MLWGMLRAAEEALDYDKPRGHLSRAGPWYLAASSLLLWAALGLEGMPGILLPALVGSIFLALTGRARAFSALRASAYPAVLVSLVAALLGPAEPLTRAWTGYVTAVGLRVYMMSATALAVMGELGPLGAVCVASRVHPVLHDVVLLLYRVAPLMVRDTLAGAWAQRMLGKGARDALVGAALSAVRRAEMLEVSLYARGSGPGRREPPCPPGDPRVGLLLLFASLGSLLAVLL